MVERVETGASPSGERVGVGSPRVEGSLSFAGSTPMRGRGHPTEGPRAPEATLRPGPLRPTAPRGGVARPLPGGPVASTVVSRCRWRGRRARAAAAPRAGRRRRRAGRRRRCGDGRAGASQPDQRPTCAVRATDGQPRRSWPWGGVASRRVDRAEEWASAVAAQLQPGLQERPDGGGEGHQALLYLCE